MTGVEIAAIITAFFGGIGALIVSISNARSSTKKEDTDALRASVQTLQGLVEGQASQILELQRENTLLHDTDLSLKAENLQQRKELEAVREENRQLRDKVDKQAAEIVALQTENSNLRIELDAYKKGIKKQTGKLGQDQ